MYPDVLAKCAAAFFGDVPFFGHVLQFREQPAQFLISARDPHRGCAVSQSEPLHPRIQAVTGHSQSFRDLHDRMPLFHVPLDARLMAHFSYQERLQNSGKSGIVVELAPPSPHPPISPK